MLTENKFPFGFVLFLLESKGRDDSVFVNAVDMSFGKNPPRENPGEATHTGDYVK